MPDLQRADPRARRHAVVAVTAGTIIGVLAIGTFTRYRSALERWLVEPADPVPRLRLLVFVLAAFVTIPSVGFAIYLWRLGARIVHTERFPLPGATVIRDTPITTGDKARRQGRLVQAAGVLIASTSVAMLLVFWLVVLSASSNF